MITIESMKKATEEAPSVWLEYVTTKQKLSGNSYFFCFFEGEDRKYYVERIKDHVKNIEVLGYVCGNRAGVIKVYEKVLSENDNMSSLLFFVDRDYNLDSYEDNEFVYQTPEYSIENLYCKPSAIKNIMEIEFGILPESNDMIFILSLFDKLFNCFIMYYSCVNIWYMACQKVGVSVRIKKFKPKNDIEFLDENLVKKNKDIEIAKVSNYYKSLLQKDVRKGITYAEENLEKYSVKLEEVNKSINEITFDYDYNKSFRGKFVLDFLKKFITYIKSMNNNKQFDKKYKHVYIDENQPNFLSTISKHAVTPPCLIEYINKHEVFIK